MSVAPALPQHNMKTRFASAPACFAPPSLLKPVKEGMTKPDDYSVPTRAIPAFRQDGAYSLMVFLHARTVRDSGFLAGAPDPEKAAVALADASQTLLGMERYRHHPYRRAVPAAPVAWRSGSVRLLDFGGSGPPVLTIPSMVNGSEIMDLSQSQSPLRWLSRQGFRVFQVDWGVPGPAERGFGLGDYLDQRLTPALDVVERLAGGPVHLLGYCMGGPLMLALAQREPDRVSKIVTLGAPWDFSAFPEHHAMRERRAEIVQLIASLQVMFGVIPQQRTQSFFALRDMDSGVAKFRRFAAMDPMSEAAKRFVAVEDWLNNGVPLSVPVGRECFLDWVIDDALRHQGWAPGGIVFDPTAVEQPALVVSAQRDTVVRRTASEPLATALPSAHLLKAGVGHIGMVLGETAIKTVWEPLADFLRG